MSPIHASTPTFKHPARPARQAPAPMVKAPATGPQAAASRPGDLVTVVPMAAVGAVGGATIGAGAGALVGVAFGIAGRLAPAVTLAVGAAAGAVVGAKALASVARQGMAHIRGERQSTPATAPCALAGGIIGYGVGFVGGMAGTYAISLALPALAPVMGALGSLAIAAGTLGGVAAGLALEGRAARP